MIEKFNIANFGSFKEFDWDQSLRDSSNNVANFKKVNVLYGRNYSGKTTISRIVRSLETGVLPPKYLSPEFEVITHCGSLNQTQIPCIESAVRVYNRDFVNENLRFLVDEAGDISPFAILGEENNEIASNILEKEGRLGSIEAKHGLVYQHSVTEAKHQSEKDAYEVAKKSLEKKLKDKATRAGSGMKHNPQDFGDVNYNLPKIKSDIDNVIANPKLLLAETEKDKRESLVRESALQDVEPLRFDACLVSLHAASRVLIEKQIKPSDSIEELLSNPPLQSWVLDGLPMHRNKKDTCGFCKSKLPDGFWIEIDNHFDEASTDLKSRVEKQIDAAKKEIRRVTEFEQSTEPTLYSEFKQSFNAARTSLSHELVLYKKAVNEIIEELQEKVGNIFGAQTASSLTYDSESLLNQIELINEIIIENNGKTESLTKDQNEARKALRLSEVASFVVDIGFEEEVKKIKSLKAAAATALEKVEKSQSLLRSITKEIEELRIEQNDESKGADKVNKLLAKYFGHDSLRLVAESEGDGCQTDPNAASKFKVLRGDSPAFNLSEGECSLLAFCYFIAKLDLESQPNNLIIFIDDPISSLDSNHVFFVYSLIESLIATAKVDGNGNKVLVGDKPVYRYEQLFISTHNLDFLKYLKRLSKPKRDFEQFLILGDADGSKIKLMPKYLKLYITEFNYLFAEICKCADSANATSEHHCFYNFGNNLRKFLEAFLFFKFPFANREQEDHNKRVVEFFKGDSCDAVLVQRLTNELSHLGGRFDQSSEPIDHAEISKLAKYVLKKIRNNDARQYECLLESVGESDPLSSAPTTSEVAAS